MTWKAKQDGTDGQETPEIKSFFMRRKQNLETGENRIYTVRYTLKGVSDSQEETLEIAAGDTVKWNFKEWYVVPKDSCVTDVEITVPADASFYLDGVQVGKKYLKETADNVSIYKIPYLFLGGHTIELTEKQKDPYREIVLVQDNSSMEFLPDRDCDAAHFPRHDTFSDCPPWLPPDCMLLPFPLVSVLPPHRSVWKDCLTPDHSFPGSSV